MMSILQISGGQPLRGSIRVQGAKNSVLPLLAATLVCRGQTVLENCPALRDVEVTLQILTHLGCQVRRSGGTIAVDAAQVQRSDIPDDLMHEMRSSVIFLGAILTRTGQAELSYPGGCELGPRPIDLHLKALRTLGAEVLEQDGRIHCRAGKLTGCEIRFPFPSVGATENAILSALGCRDQVTIHGAAREPEIVDLQNLLRAMGAEVSGAGTEQIVIRGGKPLHPVTYTVISDRIAATTWLAGAAATGGGVEVTGIHPAHIQAVLEVYEAAGCKIQRGGSAVFLQAPDRLKAVPPIRTAPYPAFPTDAQAPVMASFLRARGVTRFEETIFENRYRHVAQLQKLGAQIELDDHLAYVQGVSELHGADLVSTDLRGGAALVLAALSAEGESTVSGLNHIDRGYESIETSITNLGGTIKRLDIS